MTIFGTIWLFLSIYSFCKHDPKFILALTLFGMVFQSNNAIVLGETTGIGAQFISCGAFIVKSLFFKSKRYNNSLKTIISALTVFLIYITLNSAFFSKDGFNTIQVMMLWIYFITLHRLASIAYVFRYEQSLEIYRSLVAFILVVGFVLVVQMIGLLPDIGITEALFYNDTIGDCYYQDPEIEHSRFTATFLEPSYCAGFLVGALYFFMITERGSKKSLKLLLPIVVAILLSLSSTAFGALGISGIFYLFSKGDKKILRYAIPLALTAIIALFPLFYSILDQVIFSKGETGSALVRANYNHEAMEVYMKNPIFGQGYGTQRASSIVFTILAELGTVGIILYSLITIIVLYMSVFKKGVPQLYYGSSFIVLSAIICQIIACPDFSLCTFWLALFLLVLFVGSKEETGDFNGHRHSF